MSESVTFAALAREYGLHGGEVAAVVHANDVAYRREPGRNVVPPKSLRVLRPLLTKVRDAKRNRSASA